MCYIGCYFILKASFQLLFCCWSCSFLLSFQFYHHLLLLSVWESTWVKIGLIYEFFHPILYDRDIVSFYTFVSFSLSTWQACARGHHLILFLGKSRHGFVLSKTFVRLFKLEKSNHASQMHYTSEVVIPLIVCCDAIFSNESTANSSFMTLSILYFLITTNSVQLPFGFSLYWPFSFSFKISGSTKRLALLCHHACNAWCRFAVSMMKACEFTLFGLFSFS